MIACAGQNADPFDATGSYSRQSARAYTLHFLIDIPALLLLQQLVSAAEHWYFHSVANVVCESRDGIGSGFLTKLTRE